MRHRADGCLVQHRGHVDNERGATPDRSGTRARDRRECQRRGPSDACRGLCVRGPAGGRGTSPRSSRHRIQVDAHSSRIAAAAGGRRPRGDAGRARIGVHRALLQASGRRRPADHENTSAATRQGRARACSARTISGRIAIAASRGRRTGRSPASDGGTRSRPAESARQPARNGSSPIDSRCRTSIAVCPSMRFSVARALEPSPARPLRRRCACQGPARSIG